MTKPSRVSATLPAPFRGQLETGARTKASDCGVLATTYQIQSSSGNRIRPDRYLGGWSGWVAALRRAMQVPTGPTSTDDWMRAWRSDYVEQLYRDVGLAVPVVSELEGASWSTLKDHLRAGRFVALCVDHGVLRRQAGSLEVHTGSATFDDGHALMLAGLVVKDAQTWTNDCDSLFDGPPPPGTPEGPTIERLKSFLAPAGRFGDRPWGIGRVQAVSVRRAVPLPVPQPPPVDTDLAELEAAHSQAVDLAGQLARIIEKRRTS